MTSHFPRPVPFYVQERSQDFLKEVAPMIDDSDGLSIKGVLECHPHRTIFKNVHEVLVHYIVFDS